MIYRWTTELHVEPDEIEESPASGDTWLELATRDMKSLCPQVLGLDAEATTSTAVEFEWGDPLPGQQVKL